MTSGVMAGDDTGLNGANRLMHCMAWYLAIRFGQYSRIPEQRAEANLVYNIGDVGDQNIKH